MNVEIKCTTARVESGDRVYPLFVGFLPAEDIQKIAEAPSFQVSQTHEELASGVLRPPVKDWQRPLDIARTESIQAIFNDTGSLMPNPVLLSENGIGSESKVQITADTLKGSGGSSLKGTYTVTVDGSKKAGKKPLWILDGQHRIAGLAGSKQASNPVPVVLLLNDDNGGSYSGSDFALLFAQVTTTAKGLDPLHHAWLTFAYALGEYSDASADFEAHRAAMSAVCSMCEVATLTDGTPNPFHNLVRFNPEQTARKEPFVRGCDELKAFVYTHYYSQAREPLEPADLADEFGKALRALRSVVNGPDRSVFFGADSHALVPMQDAFMIGVMSFLRQHGPPEDWSVILKGLEFQHTDWNFQSWIKTMSGKQGSDSRKVSATVFAEAFTANALPEGERLDEYLKGNGALLEIVFSLLNANGRPVRQDRETIKLSGGDNRTHGESAHKHVKVAPSWKHSNIARLEVVDANSNPANPTKLPEIKGGGMILEGTGERDVAFTMHFFGGLSSIASLKIRW
jgi:hypothetical protein